MNIFKLFTKDSSPININDVDHIKDIEIDMDISDIDVNISEIYDTAHKQVMRDILTKKLHKLLQNYTFGKDIVDETAKINNADCEQIERYFKEGNFKSVLFIDKSFEESRISKSLRKVIGKNQHQCQVNHAKKNIYQGNSLQGFLAVY